MMSQVRVQSTCRFSFFYISPGLVTVSETWVKTTKSRSVVQEIIIQTNYGNIDAVIHMFSPFFALRDIT